VFGIQDLPLFVLSGLLLNLTPGPDTLLILTHSMRQGWRAGTAAAFGIGAGTCVHVLAAAAGLSALLTTSATAFAVVRWAGAAYLVYLGIGLLRRRVDLPPVRADDAAIRIEDASIRAPAEPLRAIFVQGFLTNLLNPKVAVFFLAFVPQFIVPQAPDKAATFIVLGLIFNANSMLWCQVLVLAGAFARTRLRLPAFVLRNSVRLIGVAFVVLGVRIAVGGRG